MTGVLLLAESPISIHTWPEHGFAAVDVFMCGAVCPELALDAIRSAMGSAHADVRTVARGL